jgi:TonB family protein
MKRYNLLPALLVLALPVLAEVKVSHAEASKAAIKKVQPDYSPLARQLRVQGEVEVEVSISPAGAVTAVKVVSGNALLTPGVTKALKKWKFQPFTERGKAAAALASLKFNFKM